MKREEVGQKIKEIEAFLKSAREDYDFGRDDEAWPDLDDAFQNLHSLHYKLDEGMPIGG